MPAPRFALVAGEASGDALGASLIAALRERHPRASFCGVAGERMRAAGCEAWFDAEELAVMGLTEVLGHLPRLLRLRRRLLRRVVDERPDALIGIDAPDFNLGLERRARGHGIRTVHYVSPTVWAWRPGRVRTIARSADLVLCLFPFEPRWYQDHGVAARYTGHPLADAIPPSSDRDAARRALGLDPQAACLALLPGSRVGEVERLAGPLLEAAGILRAEHPDLQVVAPLAGQRAAAVFEAARAAAGEAGCRVLDGQALAAMAAADVVVCASGTATLECLLVKRPMVVVYRLAPSTYRIARWLRLVRTRFVALPNILAGEALVPELLQDAVTGEAIAAEVRRWLGDAEAREALQARFAELHDRLRQDAARSAAAAVSELLEQGQADSA